MKIWKAHFRDERHDTDIDIINTEGDYNSDPVSFTLDEVTFAGTSLADLQPVETDIERAQERFNICKAGGFDAPFGEVPYWYMLQRYSLDVDIPVMAVRRRDNCDVQGTLHISYEFREHDPQQLQSIYKCDEERIYPDDLHVNDFTLHIDGKVCPAERRSLCFENPLMDISRALAPEYYLKCCFTCQYSDYSPYGCDDFGSMQCFLRQKENYLRVNTKMEYFDLLTDDYDLRQETFLCGGFEPRTLCEGYRGYVDGVGDC